MANQTQFAAAVLKGIGAPVTSKNIAGFIGWAKAEGGDNWTRNNPLNTTESLGATGTINSAGVKRYPTFQAGVAATVKTLRNGRYNGIIGAFKKNNPMAMPADELNTWGTGSLTYQTMKQTLGGPSIKVPASVSGGGNSGSNGTPGQLTASNGKPLTTTSTTTTGGGVDYQAAGLAALEKAANRPINTSGKLPTPHLLQDFASAAESGLYQLPTTTTTNKVTTPTTTYGSTSGTAASSGVKLPAGQKDVSPLPSGWKIGRTDMGVDASAAPGTPIRAMNDSKVVRILPGWFQGQPLVELQLTAGPNKGKLWYVAEQITNIPKVGQTIKRGGTVARYAPSGTGIEIGWGAAGGRTQAQATTGYSEGQVTNSGLNFKKTYGL